MPSILGINLDGALYSPKRSGMRLSSEGRIVVMVEECGLIGLHILRSPAMGLCYEPAQNDAAIVSDGSRDPLGDLVLDLE